MAAALLLGADFTTLTGRTVPDLALSLASGVVQAFCGWDIAQESVTTNLDSDGSAVIALPTLYLAGVSSVSLNGNDPQTGQPWAPLVLGTDWDWRSTGLLLWIQRAWNNAVFGWPAGAGIVAVSYTSGYAAIPPAIQAVVASVAQRIVENPAVQSHLENVGGISQNVTYAQNVTAGIGLTPLEQASLNRYRIAGIA